MKRVIALAALLLCVGDWPSAGGTQHRVWFAPGPGTLDYLRLFERPEEWRKSRDLVDVFKFYQGHTQPGNTAFAPDTYAALVGVNAFRLLRSWGKAVAIEVGVVKEFYCTPDESGMAHAIKETLDSVHAVQSAGGVVDYLAMDDPFGGGIGPTCGGPAVEPTADRIATFVKGVQGTIAADRIGLIEAYPTSSAARIESALGALKTRGVRPAFVHMDVDLNGVRPPNDFVRDVRQLRDVCRREGLPFGMIFFGNNPDADALYGLDVGKMVNAASIAFPTPDQMPYDLIIQSWAQTRSGLWITPNNLPETAQFTHTNLLLNIYRRLQGQTGPSLGTAVPR